MPYIVADETFVTKNALTERCREILRSTPDGQPVAESDTDFLFALFQYHDEWPQKSSGGARDVSTQTTVHGTRCFVLRKHTGVEIDISFPHAIRLIPSSRTADLLPQALRDFRNAARVSVRAQIYEFRDRMLREASLCPVTGEQLNRNNAAVDHLPPNTFDNLLFKYCRQRGVNPLTVRVGSTAGVLATLEDQALAADWQAFHLTHANLRLVSRVGNLQLPKATLPWQELWS